MQKTFPFLIEKYTDEVVSLEEARQWLKMDLEGYEDEDQAIESALKAAIDEVETRIDSPLLTSTYQWNTWCFPCDFGSKLRVKNIISISYHDGTNYVVLDSAKYSLVRTGELTSSIYYADDRPDVSASNFPIQVVFTAGYEIGETPEGLLQAVRALLGEYFDSKGDQVSEKQTLSDKILNNRRIPFPA